MTVSGVEDTTERLSTAGERGIVTSETPSTTANRTHPQIYGGVRPPWLAEASRIRRDKRQRFRRLIEQHHESVLVLTLCLVVAALVHGSGMYDSPMRVDDEGTYVAQAWAVQHWRQLAHYTYWYDHPPIGWIHIAGWTWLTHAFERAPSAVAAGREFMLIVHLAASMLLWVVARRLLLSIAAAAAAVGLFSLSPLAVAFHRMVFLDNVATPWLLAAFALALSPRRRLAAAVGSAMCLAIAVLSKETVLLLAPAVVLQLWRHWRPETRRMAGTLWLATLATTGLLYPLYAALKGELVPGPDHVSLLSALHWQLFARSSSGRVLEAESAARGVVENWLQLDAWLLVAALVSTPISLGARRLRPIVAALVVQVVLLVGRDGYLPYPYVIGMLPFAALLVPAAIDTVLRHPKPRTSPTRVLLRAAQGAIVATVIALTAVVAPAWRSGIATLAVGDEDRGMRQASQWVLENVPRDQQIVVDDALWVDFVEAGFDPSDGAIWFYKLDLDPAVKLSDGWRSVDYAVLAGDPAQFSYLPKVSRIIKHSTVVGHFGTGSNKVTVYRNRRSTDSSLAANRWGRP